MKDVNILIVEDESIVAMEIESYITDIGFNVVAICSNAEDALDVVANTFIDIVLMDISIEGDIDGIETAIKILNIYPYIKVIFLTAYLDDYNVDRAIKIDPIAYLSKPFNKEELRVALKIANRKCNSTLEYSKSKSIKLDHEFSYDLAENTLYCCGEVITLTKKENELLELFVEHKNYVLELYTIENVIWSEKEITINTIRTLVKRLRQKLKHKFIESVPSRGYRMNVMA